MAGFEDFELTAPQPPVPSGPVPRPKQPSFRERQAAGQLSSSLTPSRLAEDHADDIDPANIDQLEQEIERSKDPKIRGILIDEHNRIRGRVSEEIAAKASFDDFEAASAPVTANTNVMRWAEKRRQGKPDVTEAALNAIPLADLILGLPTFIAQVGTTGAMDIYYALQGEGKPLEAANKKMEEVMATPWMKFLAAPASTLLPADTSKTTVHEVLGGIEGAIKSASEYWAEKTDSTEVGEGLKQATQIAMLEGGRTFVKGFKDWQAKRMADPELNLGTEPLYEGKARRPGSADPGVSEGVIVSETRRGSGERLPAPKKEAGSIFDVEKDVAKFSEADLKATGLTRDELRRTLNEAAMPDRMKFLAATAGAGAAGLAGQALWDWLQETKDKAREGEPQPNEDGTLLAVLGLGVIARARLKETLPKLHEQARSIKGDVVDRVELVGSTAAKGVGRDVDLLYTLKPFELPKDSVEAAALVESKIESIKTPIPDHDSFWKIGDRYFHTAKGAGRSIVENTAYAKEQVGKPTIELGPTAAIEAISDQRVGPRDLSDSAMLRRTAALHRESGRRLSEVSPEQLAAYRRGELHEGDPAWRTIKEAEALGQPNDWRARQRGVLPNEGGNITVETAAKLAALGIGAAAGAYLAPDSKFFGAAVGAAAVLAAMALRRSDSAIRREVRDSIEAARREFHPAFYVDAAKRKGAKLGEAVIASNISRKMQSDSAIYHASEASRRYWDKIGTKEQADFIRGFERGWTSKDPVLRAMAERYRAWNADIYAREQKLGIEYEARDHYLYHTFENPEGVAAFLGKKYGTKWGDPKFSKERGFDYYDEAIKGGFKPKTLNPEQIMLNRQYASNVAEMRINILQDLRDQGLARIKSEAHLNTVGEEVRRAPDGQVYYVDPRANLILHNAFDTESLWNRRDAIGSVFRGGMEAKNTIVPIILNLSLFHPLHLILGMDNSAAMLRSIKLYNAGVITSGQHLSAMVRAGNPITAIYDSAWTNPKAGWRPFQLWKGKVPSEKVTAADREILERTFDGGFIPEMAQEWKTHAIENFKKSWDSGDVAAIPKFLLAIPQYLQKPLFEYWIPQLKYASYLKDTEAALAANPTLRIDQGARIVAFRKIAKSVENRYGEMAYSTLFWGRLSRDIGVLNTLSLGWSLGFFREYGGGLREAGHGVINLNKQGKIAKGELDRAIFVMLYTANTALYGGIATWMLTGQPPTEWLDYFYPKTGDKKKDGTAERVNTMFYSREWLGMFKHMQNEGMLSGASHFMLNKLAPTWGISKGLWTNLDFFGKEISDPNSPAFKQLVQKVAWAAGEVTPIPIQSMKKQGGELTVKKAALNFAGFSPAPKYATETPLEGKIASMYRQYHSSITPYARAQRGDETRELYGLKQQGDDEGFNTKLDEMREKYKLSHADVVRIRKSAAVPPTERMFRNLSSEQQVRLLGSMSSEEKERFRPYLKKEVRRNIPQDE